MKRSLIWTLALLLFPGCYQRQDPVVRAAQDLRDMAYDFAREEEARKQQFNSLELGMSGGEVLNKLGPPAVRRSVGDGPEESREVWTYHRAAQPPVTLTFVNQRLTEIRME